ncbi:hypothetical protein CYMTET_8428, partial [Cymbomonas tetramitiformis]
MIVDKPSWISHHSSDDAAQSIYCIDVHVDSSRLATAGADGKVKIWNMQPIMNPPTAGETKDEEPKVLQTLCDHVGHVIVVRFSPNGIQIASGAVDKAVCVYHFCEGRGSQVFGSNDPPPVENWKLRHHLSGHQADVVDLAWSGVDKLLAIASVDNTISIWETVSWKRVATLTQHNGLVKGLAWDPIGRYLVSQSDDKYVIVWRTGDWQVAHRIGPDIFSNIINIGYSLRPSFSPDGACVTCARGFLDGVHVAPVLERQNKFARENSFVAHKAAVLVATFNPRMFYSKNASVK